jgi:hypothetical protein
MLCFSSQWVYKRMLRLGEHLTWNIGLCRLPVSYKLCRWPMQSAGSVDIWNSSQIKREGTTQPFVRRRYWIYPADALVHVASSLKFCRSYWKLCSPTFVHGTGDYGSKHDKYWTVILRRSVVHFSSTYLPLSICPWHWWSLIMYTVL